MPTIHEEVIVENPNQAGFWKEFPIGFPDLRTNAANPAVLTGATTPIYAHTAHQGLISWVAGDASSVLLWSGKALPRDIDTAETNQTTGKRGANIVLDITIQKAGTTNGGTFTATIYARTPGSATLKGPFTATSAAAPNSATFASRVSCVFCASRDANDARLEPGDVIEEFSVAPVAHATDAILVTSFSIRAKCNIPFAKDVDRTNYPTP